MIELACVLLTCYLMLLAWGFMIQLAIAVRAMLEKLPNEDDR